MRTWLRMDSNPQSTSSEVWGGNDIVDVMKVPGFMGWVHSKPLPPATEGDDVYYVTVSPAVCFRGSSWRTWPATEKLSV
jgi:hypothetical protein